MNPYQIDQETGNRVHQALQAAGIETPMAWYTLSFIHDQAAPPNEDTPYPHSLKKGIAHHMSEIMKMLGLDLEDASLRETPNRIAKMYVDELFRGLDYHNFPKCTAIPRQGAFHGEEMVIERGITVHSTCEHHFITIDGKATVAYIPDKLVVGLSKMNRVVDFFARRPQVQERLTSQIMVALQTILETQSVAVHIGAVHYCVKARGIMDQSSDTHTLALGGKFLEDRDLRKEFLGVVHG